MMRLAPSGDRLGRIARLMEEGTIRPDVAKVYALEDAAQAWEDITAKLPGVHGMSPSGPGAVDPGNRPIPGYAPKDPAGIVKFCVLAIPNSAESVLTCGSSSACVPVARY